MRGHAVAERFEVTLVGREILTGQRVEVVVVAVQPLTAGDELHTAKEQVEAVRDRRPFGIRVRVERPLRHRVAAHEQEVGPVLARGPLPQPTLVRGREVGLADDVLAGGAFDHGLRRGEVDDGDVGGNVGKAELELRERVGACSGIASHHPVEDIAEDPHDVAMVTDEPDLGVE